MVLVCVNLPNALHCGKHYPTQCALLYTAHFVKITSTVYFRILTARSLHTTEIVCCRAHSLGDAILAAWLPQQQIRVRPSVL